MIKISSNKGKAGSICMSQRVLTIWRGDGKKNKFFWGCSMSRVSHFFRVSIIIYYTSMCHSHLSKVPFFPAASIILLQVGRMGG